MDAYQAILTRRSIRQYTDQAVPPEVIRQLLAAAMQAPSAGNGQPWLFVVATERRVLDALAGVLPYGKMLLQAPLGVIVCGDLRMDPGRRYWVQDCSAATENLLLAAHALGLGAVWLGVYPQDDRVKALRIVLGLPEGVIPLAAIAIGYPAETIAPVDRYSEQRVHYNGW